MTRLPSSLSYSPLDAAKNSQAKLTIIAAQRFHVEAILIIDYRGMVRHHSAAWVQTTCSTPRPGTGFGRGHSLAAARRLTHA